MSMSEKNIRIFSIIGFSAYVICYCSNLIYSYVDQRNKYYWSEREFYGDVVFLLFIMSHLVIVYVSQKLITEKFKPDSNYSKSVSGKVFVGFTILYVVVWFLIILLVISMPDFAVFG
jgi:hypothetical protein